METDQYVTLVNGKLERLLVFETVFKEYFHTCRNIDKGNCLASENLEHLSLYLTKNVISFKHYLKECAAIDAPVRFVHFNQTLLNALHGMYDGVKESLDAITPTKLNHERFEDGVAKLQQYRERLNAAFDRLSGTPA